MDNWYGHALAAISEGFCPEHQVQLQPDGFCAHCGHKGAWWSIRYEDDLDIGAPQVVTTYPPLRLQPVS